MGLEVTNVMENADVTIGSILEGLDFDISTVERGDNLYQRALRMAIGLTMYYSV